MADSLSDADVLEELKQWKVNRPSKPSRLLPKSGFGGPADRSYTLKNGKVRKFLQHEEQSVGINLGWTDDAEPSTGAKVARWFFARSGASDKPLVYGETLAIGNGGSPSFIRNKKRTAGIDLTGQRRQSSSGSSSEASPGRRSIRPTTSRSTTRRRGSF